MKPAFEFVDIIPRKEKPRSAGLTMVLDKGLSVASAADLIQSALYIDIVKLGWATARLMAEDAVREKIQIYNRSGIMAGNGGTLIEIVYKQQKLPAFFSYCREIGIELIEVSNGVFDISHTEKADIIRQAQESGFYVISEVGKKDVEADKQMTLRDRIEEARSDIEAGAHYVIIEAREGGKNIGVYDEKGCLRKEMARALVESIGLNQIMFEAPEKSQQRDLILLFGPDVNLGNVRPEDVIPLETLRRGIRGDTCGKL